MRENLFRAKIKSKEELIGKGFPINDKGELVTEWVFGVPIPRYPDLFLAWNEACNEYEEVNIIPETIGECVNVPDKNGTKIFEGDILKIIDGKEIIIASVKFGDYNQPDKILKTHIGFYFDIANLASYRKDMGYWFGKTFSEIEVIGNIHDNPELLKE